MLTAGLTLLAEGLNDGYNKKRKIEDGNLGVLV